MKIKNKMAKYAILGIGVIGITVLCIVIYNFFRIRKITDFFENNPADIENITIMSGNNGNIVYVAEEDFGAVTEILSGLSFPGINKGEPRDGWDYQIFFHTAICVADVTKQLLSQRQLGIFVIIMQVILIFLFCLAISPTQIRLRNGGFI